MLAISKTALDELLQTFPAQQDVLVGSLLETLGLLRDGSEAAGAAVHRVKHDETVSHTRDGLKV